MDWFLKSYEKMFPALVKMAREDMQEFKLFVNYQVVNNVPMSNQCEIFYMQFLALCEQLGI